MKARVVKSPEIVLCYNLSEESLVGISKVCDEEKVGIKLVDGTDLEKSVGYLAEVVGAVQSQQSCGEVADVQVVVLCNVAESKKNRLLNKIGGISTEIIRALLTPTSAKWHFGALVNELASEHNELSKR